MSAQQRLREWPGADRIWSRAAGCVRLVTATPWRAMMNYNGRMLVRPMRSEDLPAVSRLAAELVRLHHRLDAERFLLIEPIEDGYRWFFGRELERKRAVLLVAEERKRIVGYAYGTLESRNWNDLLDACGKVNDILVDPTTRQRGVGRALMEAMLDRLKELGAPRVVLLTAWRNPDAHAFFESLGFRRTMLEMTRESESAKAAPADAEKSKNAVAKSRSKRTGTSARRQRR